MLQVSIAPSTHLALTRLSDPERGPFLAKGLALHGYTGEALDLKPFLAQESSLKLDWYGLDLLGHGRSSNPENRSLYTETSYIQHLDRLIQDIFGGEAITLLAYSFGGRLALHYALQRPQNIQKLILISATPGIDGEERRLKRKIADGAIVDKLKTLSIPAFMDYWYQTPIIKSQKNSPRFDELYARRLEHTSPMGLIHSLEAFGQGVASSLWPMLPTLNIPVLWIVGAEDPLYVEIAQKACKLLPRAKLEIVHGAGHAPHLENEAATLKALAEAGF